LVTVTPQCSNGGWPKLPRLAKVTPVHGSNNSVR